MGLGVSGAERLLWFLVQIEERNSAHLDVREVGVRRDKTRENAVFATYFGVV